MLKPRKGLKEEINIAIGSHFYHGEVMWKFRGSRFEAWVICGKNHQRMLCNRWGVKGGGGANELLIIFRKVSWFWRSPPLCLVELCKELYTEERTIMKLVLFILLKTIWSPKSFAFFICTTLLLYLCFFFLILLSVSLKNVCCTLK